MSAASRTPSSIGIQTWRIEGPSLSVCVQAVRIRAQAAARSRIAGFIIFASLARQAGSYGFGASYLRPHHHVAPRNSVKSLPAGAGPYSLPRQREKRFLSLVASLCVVTTRVIRAHFRMINNSCCIAGNRQGRSDEITHDFVRRFEPGRGRLR